MNRVLNINQCCGWQDFYRHAQWLKFLLDLMEATDTSTVVDLLQGRWGKTFLGSPERGLLMRFLQKFNKMSAKEHLRMWPLKIHKENAHD